MKSDFVLERMENEKYDFSLEMHKIRPLIDMDLNYFFNFRHILVDSEKVKFFPFWSRDPALTEKTHIFYAFFLSP